GAAVWCGAIILAPFLAASSSPLSVVVYQFFHPICHQLPERSFSLFGEKFAVCSRCSSVYFSFLFVAALYPFVRSLTTPAIPHRNWLLLSLLPMLIDVGLEVLNLHDSTFATRTLTGSAFGAVVALYILPAAIEAMQQISAKRFSSSTI
ncbi:MAG: DUF2085 domain-containing protein, partial [bacterium]